MLPPETPRPDTVSTATSSPKLKLTKLRFRFNNNTMPSSMRMKLWSIILISGAAVFALYTLNVNNSGQVQLVGIELNGSRASVKSAPYDVLITTYMRSGSSFLGKVLGWRNDTFYVYEPLWKDLTWKYYKGHNQLCNSSYPTCVVSRENSLPTVNESQSYLLDLYRCNLEPHSDRLIERLHTYKQFAGPSWESYRKCRKMGKTKKKCLSVVVAECQQSTHRATKVLRMGIDNAATLLLNNPRLKIIQLFRDPRSIINSRLTAKWYKLKQKPFSAKVNDIKVLCSRIMSDIRTGKQLLKEFPDRIKIVQYEDFEHPIKQYARLYNFLGMSFSASYRRFAESLARPVSDKNEGSGGSRGFHPFAYRKMLDWTIVKVVDKYCGDVYKELGYIRFSNERELRDTRIRPVQTHLPFAL